MLFVIKFFAIFSIIGTAINYVNLEWFTSAIAFFEAKMFSLPYTENLLLLNGQIYEINNSCTGLLSATILAGIVFALKKPDFKNKLKIFLTGAILLIPINLARIAGVLLVGINFGTNAAEIMHVISWFFTTGIILLLWYKLTAKKLGKKGFKEMI